MGRWSVGGRGDLGHENWPVIVVQWRLQAESKQGCRSLMLWPCSEQASQRMFWVRSQEKGCPVLTPASGRASLLWTSYVSGMSHRTVWTKTIDKIRLTTTSSEESQKTWGLVISNSWSLRKSSCTTRAWTWIWNVKLRMHRVQKERELNLERRSCPSVSLKKSFFFFFSISKLGCNLHIEWNAQNLTVQFDQFGQIWFICVIHTPPICNRKIPSCQKILFVPLSGEFSASTRNKHDFDIFGYKLVPAVLEFHRNEIIKCILFFLHSA